MTDLLISNSLQHRVALLLIIALGIALRIYAWHAGEGYLYYAINDEMVAYRYALGFLAGEEHTYYLAQPAFASGQAPGPVWTLFWVALLKLGNGSVHYALLWMTLFNSLAIYLFYRFARHFLPANLTLFATLFFAVAPWTVYYSIGMWNPLPLVVIGCLLFLTLWNVLNQDQSRQIFWVCVFSAIFPQFHMIGVFYLPVILFLLYITPKTLNRTWFVLGICAALLIYLPYFIGEWQHGFANTKAMLSGTDKPSFGVFKVITAPLTILTSIPAGWAGREFSATVEYATGWFGSIYILLVFCVLSLVYVATAYFSFVKKFFILIKNSWKTPRTAFTSQPQLYFLGTMIFFPLLLFILTRHDYATRYTLLIFPLLFVIPALFYNSIQSVKFRRIFGMTTLVILTLNIYLLLSFYSHQADKIADDTYFAPSFKSLETLAQELYTKTDDNQRIRIALSDKIQKLPQGERKIAVAVTEYFELINEYKIGDSRPPNYLYITMYLYNEEPATNVGKILLQTNGMYFIDSSSL